MGLLLGAVVLTHPSRALAAPRVGPPSSAAFHPCFPYDMGCATVWIITHGTEGWVRVRPDPGVILWNVQMFIRGHELDSPPGWSDWARPEGAAHLSDPREPFQQWMVDSDFGGGFDLFTSASPLLGCGDWNTYVPTEISDENGNVIDVRVDTIPLWPGGMIVCGTQKQPAWMLFHLVDLDWRASDVRFDPRISAPPVSIAPEPSTLALAMTGLCALVWVTRMRRGARARRERA
ncbi:PEP-CTERM sorting domain-containing protein [Gemmatirosa kalamazoonensis]|nr:PEP-CTERM sorting domain-containing protein [Gemmatirosa kalamazoonensis]